MITASLGLNWSNFQRGIQNAMNSTRQLGGAMQQSMTGGIGAGIMSAVSNISALEIAMRIATFSIRGFYEAIQYGDDLVDLNAQTGVAIDKLMELQMAFDLNGMKAAQVQPVLSKMQRMIAEAGSGSAEAAAKFSMMGIQIAEIQGLNADEQLMKIGEAITEIQNPAQRSAMAMEIFGKSGAKLLSVFSAGGMNEVHKVLGNQTALLLENAGIFGRASDILGLTGSKIRGFFVGIASEILPQIMQVLEKSAELDFSKIGQGIGAGVSFWINYFENFGSTGNLIYNTLKLAFANAINYLSEELAVNLAVAGAGLRNVFSSEDEKMKAMKEAEIQARTSSQVVDTTSIEQSIESAMGAINASKEATAAAAREKYPTPGAAPTGMDMIRKLGTGGPLGMSDVSSLQKVGGGSALLTGMQDNSPAYQSVRIQEDIRDYIQDLIQAVKEGSQDYQIAPNYSGGMVLTA
jgi:hypothetical protein